MDSLFFNALPPELSDTASYQPLDAAHAQMLLGDVVAAYDEAVGARILHHAVFFQWLVEGSSFLRRLLHRYPEVLTAFCETPPRNYLTTLIDEMTTDLAQATSRTAAMALMRHARNRLALGVALADLSDQGDLGAVTACLTAFADAAVSQGLSFLLREAHEAGLLREARQPGKLIPPPHTEPSHAGLVVLALGKHGGEELNYSSDIDIVIYYTPDAMPLAVGLDERVFFVTLARDLTAMLQDVTQDGFVFRVDLRLRPDPGATQIAISVPAALGYYESMGQNWERAVYIKARPIAGDLAAGEKFLHELTPYIWRRYYDYAAIDDVHSMKRQIHAVRGHASLATRGHNLKLGRGGIREIEFFVQTQQLIAGGRDPDLRGSRTVDMLAVLAAKNWITQQAADSLTKSYYFLRRMEHRLQMRLDEQTQTLPRDESDFARFARFAAFADAPAFEAALTDCLEQVTKQYARLFEQSQSLSASTGNLVFTGAEEDPETLTTLREMGFCRPAEISALIRGWHAGRLPATRSARAREILTRLQPHLLARLAHAGDPDDSFIRFNNFLEKLPAGVQIFSLFQSQPKSFDMLTDIIIMAPRLAGFLTSNGRLVDFLITPITSETPLIASTILPHMPAGRVKADQMEKLMEDLRVSVHEAQFHIGTRVLADPCVAEIAGPQYTQLAEQAMTRLLGATHDDIARQYGVLPDGRFSVLGFGKLGSGELSLQSDLDLILVCDCDDFTAVSSGSETSTKALTADVWFARLARRFLGGLSVPTVHGCLYEVDTRLRPSGNAGALVTKLSSFATYQNEAAWTWEHMALTRARVICGTSELGARLEALIGAVVQRPRDAAVLAAGVADMRARLQDHQPLRGPFDIRRGAGGLVDIEFFCQMLVLHHSAREPALVGPRTMLQTLSDLHQAGCLSDTTFSNMNGALTLFLRLRQISSLCLEDDETAPAPATQALLLETVNEPDIGRLHEAIERHRRLVVAAFAAQLAQMSDA